MHKEKDLERKRKHRKRFRVILEIVFMALGILCSIMPQPFPLVVPIGIGAIRIISNAARKEKATEAPPQIVYCNGDKEPKKSRASKATASSVVQVKAKPTAKAVKDTVTKAKKKGEDK